MIYKSKNFPDKIAISEFLNTARPVGLLCLVSIKPDGPLTAHTFEMPSETETATHWAFEQNSNGANVYWTVNPVNRKVKTKPSKADIVRCEYAHVDIDPVLDEGYENGRKQLFDKQLPKLHKHQGKATIIIDSGNGLAAFYRFKQPVSVEQVEDINRALIKMFKGDIGTHNCDRIMRLPGTLNYPNKTKIGKGYPSKPTRAKLIAAADISYTLGELSGIWPESLFAPSKIIPDSEDKFTEDETPLSNDESTLLKQRLDNDLIVDFFLKQRWDGATAGLNDSSRSGMAMSLGAMLHNRGYSYRDMRHILISWDQGAGAEKAENGNERYFRRIWTRAKSLTNQSRDSLKHRMKGLQVTGELNHAKWTELIYHSALGPAAEDEILNFLVKLGIGKKQPLRNEYRKRKAEFEKLRKRQDQAERTLRLVSNRQRIVWNPLDLNSMMLDTEQALLQVPGRWECVLHGGAYSYIAIAPPDKMHQIDQPTEAPPAVPRLRLYNRNSMRLRIEQSACFLKNGKIGPEPIPVPKDLPFLLLDNPEPRAPHVMGLLTHPIVLSNGHYLACEGYDIDSGLFLHFGGAKFHPLPDELVKDTAEVAIAEIHDDLFCEFEWRDKDLDFFVAVSLLMTTLLRKSLDLAPGFLINANVQGSGKTTLVRMVYIIAAGHDMPVASLSDDPQEARKAMLAMLLESIPLTCFDNVPDGFEVHNAVLAKVLTSPYFKDRVLGLSKEIRVPTNTVIALTGNNISVDSDLARRILPCYLKPESAKPEQRQFRNPDILGHVMQLRPGIIRAALTITKSYLNAGCPKNNGHLVNSGYPLWDRLVRFPLLWASGIDVLNAVNNARDESSETVAMNSILMALIKIFPNKEQIFPRQISVILSKVRSPFDDHSDVEEILYHSMSEMSARTQWNPRSVGWVLKKLIDRPLHAGMLKRRTSEAGQVYWVA